MTEHWVQFPSEPKQLILAWQAPDHMKDRRRWAVADLYPDGNDIALRYYTDDLFAERNAGARIEKASELGYVGYPGFSLKRDLHRQGVLQALMRRVPPRSRSDFGDYKKMFRVAKDTPLSDLVLLGHTQAHLPSDGFSVVDPLDADAECCDLLLEVAGFRYYKSEIPFEIGLENPVEIAAEPDNEFDRAAVQFKVFGQKIGNVNRLQAPTFLSWLASGRQFKAHVERINGASERPRIFIFIKMRAANFCKTAA